MMMDSCNNCAIKLQLSEISRVISQTAVPEDRVGQKLAPKLLRNCETALQGSQSMARRVSDSSLECAQSLAPQEGGAFNGHLSREQHARIEEHVIVKKDESHACLVGWVLGLPKPAW
jgi:hypothetical protein